MVLELDFEGRPMAARLMQKLQLKSGERFAIINPPKGMYETLASEMENVHLTTETTGLPDGVLGFVRSKEELLSLAPLVFQIVKPGGLAWIAFPKGGSGVATDLNRDKLWAALESSGWRPVRNIAIDEVWSALRFRPAELIGK
jgi:hypothetical protein